MENILINLVDLKKQYKSQKQTINALDGVSFDIYKSEVISLLGVNGAGKTTLSSVIVTLHPPTSGDIFFEGKSIYKDINEYRRHIGFCPQKPNLNEDLTVEQNLFFAGLYFGFSKNWVKNKVDELVEKFALEKYLYSFPEMLSGGYKQRVLIARALMHEPRLLVLDEPTVGLDPHIRHHLWENIRDLKKEGVTVLLTTHYIDEAEVLSDRIVMMDKGKIRLIDTPQNLMTIYDKSRLEDVFLQLSQEESVAPSESD